jgi:hypothetical protein
VREDHNPVQHLLIITLKPTRAFPEGRVLHAPFPDRDTAEAELRCIERFRQGRWGLPEISVTTVDGERWCLGYNDIQWPVQLAPAESVPAAI